MDGNDSQNTSNLVERIAGKRVVAADGDTLTLDDGTKLHLYMSASDCCASAYGDWVIRPDALEAVITDARIEVIADRADDGDGATSHAKITILHNQNPVALADCYANDGNGGYYFSVLSLRVTIPESDDAFEMEVVSA